MTSIRLSLAAVAAAFTLSSCSVPETVVEETYTTMDEMEKERKIGDDIEISPSEDNKVKMQF